ncbi:hypothetical protein CALVIDRAFT_536847 [Calocera viscosa TUFC12733]|uniref:Uncharacterized protein n=1 Tax=Calocera viscosa (strain TUFC12733) TaxID=1330018 RepID=A0A167MPC5_CALVF|nr:hypothetical protein CALVIDRAFT_536847 [Calocera viscosa TUFC12733]
MLARAGWPHLAELHRALSTRLCLFGHHITTVFAPWCMGISPDHPRQTPTKYLAMPLLEPEYIDERSVRDLLRASPTPSGSTNETGSENPEPELDMESDDDSRPPSPTPIPASVRFPGKFPKPPMRAPRAEEDYMSEASYYSDRDGSVSGSQGVSLPAPPSRLY